ncbi:hypothetical protein [Streptomyces sp. NPDC001985]|uniref:hypothetical protein n=1 Tax=Streptomyces sp. NPDC001985 TaxID=3154406 RepID=UPI00331AEE82
MAASLIGGVNAAVAVDDVPGPDWVEPTGPQYEIDIPSAPPITALNFESELKSVQAGFESRRWSDEQYSEIQFKTCNAQSGSQDYNSTDVKLWHHKAAAPDESQGSKVFTNCFKGVGKVSRGEWRNVPKGSTYFEIDKIGGYTESQSPYAILTVKKVNVDTTAAD